MLSKCVPPLQLRTSTVKLIVCEYGVHSLMVAPFVISGLVEYAIANASQIMVLDISARFEFIGVTLVRNHLLDSATLHIEDGLG